MAVCFATFSFGDSVAYIGTPDAVDRVADRLRRQARSGGQRHCSIRVTHQPLTNRDCEGYVCKLV